MTTKTQPASMMIIELKPYQPSGKAGSGPAQLALALLADATRDDALAVAVHQLFKEVTIAALPRSGPWRMPRALVEDRARALNPVLPGRAPGG
jgi:hypothetical protein